MNGNAFKTSKEHILREIISVVLIVRNRTLLPLHCVNVVLRKSNISLKDN